MKRLLSGAIWSLAGNILIRFFGFFSLAALVRILGAADFGRYALLFAWVQNTQMMTGLGIDTAMQRELPRETAQGHSFDRSIVLSALLWPLLVAVLGSIFIILRAPYVAEHWLGNPELASAVRWACAGIILSPFPVVVTGLYASRQEFRLLAKANLLTAAVLAVSILAGGLFFGYQGAVAAAALSGGVQVWFLCRHEITRRAMSGRKLKAIISHSWSLLRLGLPFFVGNTLAGALGGVCATTIIARYVPINEVGALRIGQSLVNVLALLPTALTGVVLPSASRFFLEETKRYIIVRPFHIKFMFSLGCAAAVATIPFVPEWLHVFHLSGDQARRTVELLVLAMPLLSVIPAITTYLVAEGSTVMAGIGSTLGSAVLLLLSFLLIPRMGLNGYCIAIIGGSAAGIIFLLERSGWRFAAGGVSVSTVFSLVGLAVILVLAYFVPEIAHRLVWRVGSALVFTTAATVISWSLLFNRTERGLFHQARESIWLTLQQKTPFLPFRVLQPGL